MLMYSFWLYRLVWVYFVLLVVVVFVLFLFFVFCCCFLGGDFGWGFFVCVGGFFCVFFGGGIYLFIFLFGGVLLRVLFLVMLKL